jgi:hypothetical protein
MLTPALFWAHVRAILPWTTAALPWLGEEQQQEQEASLAAEEGEEDGAVERRVLALVVGAGDGGSPSTAAHELSERLWNVPGTDLWTGHDACLRSGSRRWGGILRFVSFDKGVAAARREHQQQQQQEEEGRPGANDGAVVIIEEVDEGEGRRGELAREGLPRAIVAFRR